MAHGLFDRSSDHLPRHVPSPSAAPSPVSPAERDDPTSAAPRPSGAPGGGRRAGAALIALLGCGASLLAIDALADDRTAAPAGRTAPSAKVPEPEEEDDTEDVFGFSSGSDILGKGRREVAVEPAVSIGRRAGRYRAGTFTTTFGFAPIDHLSFELGAKQHRMSVRDIADSPNRNTAGFGGATLEVKWQILRRGVGAPFGLTVALEPGIGFLDEDGSRGKSFEAESRISLDTALIPHRLFATVNLTYAAERTRPPSFLLFDGDGEAWDFGDEDPPAVIRRTRMERSSRWGVSAALSYEVVDELSIGAEIRHLRAFRGLAADRLEGQATFLGPTMRWEIRKGLELSAAWSSQIAGQARGGRGHLNLETFSRHEAKMQLAYEF